MVTYLISNRDTKVLRNMRKLLTDTGAIYTEVMTGTPEFTFEIMEALCKAEHANEGAILNATSNDYQYMRIVSYDKKPYYYDECLTARELYDMVVEDPHRLFSGVLVDTERGIFTAGALTESISPFLYANRKERAKARQATRDKMYLKEDIASLSDTKSRKIYTRSTKDAEAQL